MEPNRSLWPLLVILLLSLAVASFFWWPRSASAPSFFDDSDASSAASETKEQTAASQKPATTPKNVSDAGKRIFEGGVYVTLIEYGKSGFAPSSVTVVRGEEVRFINRSGGTMRIGTDTLKTSPVYENYKQADTVGAGGIFQISLHVPGTWVYQNLNTKPPVGGTITVTEPD